MSCGLEAIPWSIFLPWLFKRCDVSQLKKSFSKGDYKVEGDASSFPWGIDLVFGGGGIFNVFLSCWNFAFLWWLISCISYIFFCFPYFGFKNFECVRCNCLWRWFWAGYSDLSSPSWIGGPFSLAFFVLIFWRVFSTVLGEVPILTPLVTLKKILLIFKFLDLNLILIWSSRNSGSLFKVNFDANLWASILCVQICYEFSQQISYFFHGIFVPEYEGEERKPELDCDSGSPP